MTTKRQKMLDQRWNSCSVCGKSFVIGDETVTFQKHISQRDASDKIFSEHCIITHDPTFQDVNLVQKISIHQQCFIEIAGAGFSFWEEDWDYEKC